MRPVWMYSSKVVVLGQGGFIQKKIGCNLVKWLYSGKVVVFGQKLL